MAIREFRCRLGHTTEKILFGDEDRSTISIECQHQGVTELCDQHCDLKSPDHKCRLDAARVEMPSRSSFRLKPGGVGGFYSPHQD